MARARPCTGGGAGALPGAGAHDELAVGLPGADHGVACPRLSATLLARATGQPLGLDEPSAWDPPELHVWRPGDVAPTASRIHHTPSPGRLGGDGSEGRGPLV